MLSTSEIAFLRDCGISEIGKSVTITETLHPVVYESIGVFDPLRVSERECDEPSEWMESDLTIHSPDP